MEETFTAGQEVFALLKDTGYYYPGIILDISSDRAFVSFWDNEKDWVELTELVDSQIALSSMHLQGNWKNRRKYYCCKLISAVDEPLQVLYDDGMKEVVKLHQLRAAKNCTMCAGNKAGKTMGILGTLIEGVADIIDMITD